MVHREDAVVCVGSFPEARPVLGEVTETLCAAGTEQFGRTGSGAFPGRAIPRARVPFGDRQLFPGRV